MIWLIAKKDFILNLTSSRFVIGFLLCLVIIPFTMVVSVDGYKNQMRVYEVDRAEALKKWQEVKVYSAVRPEIVKEPEALGIFTRGIEGNMGNSLTIRLGEYPLLLTGHAGTRDNPLLNAFFSIDFTTVIAILMSLLALVFSFDLFTREREEGTMKLVFTNGVSRSAFLMAKFLGVFITLVPILFFSFMLSTLIVVLNPAIAFSSAEWLGIILLFGAAILYLMVFILLGMVISAWSKKSSTAIVVSLLAWVWLLFLVPDIAYYSSQSVSKVAPYDNVLYSLDELDRVFREKTDEKWGEIQKQMGLDGIGHWNWSGGYDGYDELYGCTWETNEFHRRLNAWREPARLDNADKKWTFQKEWLDGLQRQERTRQVMSWLSPSEIFQQIASSLCRTSPESYLNYMQRIREYRATLIAYFHGKKLFESFSYFTQQDPKTFLTIAKTQQMEEEGFFDSKNFKVPPYWEGSYYLPLNLDDVPKFTFQKQNAAGSLKASLGLVVGLLSLGIALFLVVIGVFQKYDVR
ncbi:MAG TPA: hypothetical protein DCR43_01425 [Bacteroidales bacterium]|nr:MAG: hypothetical protein A2X11_14000 [Bacteroidetes bacterium GWE2_42_24]OFY28293.1 MAG: hypothetical protein A2X09_16140 [Bacteroidetes bacterium GWF2_43_11]PKP27877.1 MAG: hypothetical protein CVU06_00775 [Bacteroidetes bacterium HGW-Bacteroidetes-22]HAQ64511.1 hypothetical protein [Bacteroidales bacterium]HBZ66207.1 hypothetical protein [Bacteroidales bacterium]